MLETSVRLLRLLSLLQVRRDWSGADLAGRLGVTTRTVRNDIERLRILGYEVHSSTGITGGYRTSCCASTTGGATARPRRRSWHRAGPWSSGSSIVMTCG
jgi:biotin operon repressor